jgi:membrane protease YdiL (CAAX protease family)
VGGFVVFFLIGPMASSEGARFVLIALGAVGLSVGLAAAAGSQIMDRRDRHPERYRGPAPVLVFFAYFFALAFVGIAVFASGLSDADAPFGFLSVGLVQVFGYAVVVWLFVVKSDSLSWRQMGWPTWQGRGLQPTLRSIGVAVAVMLPMTFVILLISGVLAAILGVEAPDVLPSVETSLEAFAVAAGAALVIPIGEELFFRGFALTAWLRDLGPRTAIIRSALFFALIHIANITTGDFLEGAGQALLQTAAILPVGLVLGWLFVRNGMAAAIGGHVTYNSLLLFLLLLSSYLPEQV